MFVEVKKYAKIKFHENFVLYGIYNYIQASYYCVIFLEPAFMVLAAS